MTLTLVGGIFALLLLCAGFISVIVRELKKNARLEDQLKRQKENSIYLIEHSSEIAEIKKNELDTANAIAGAKSNEEILDIINSIIHANNKLCE